MGGKGTEVVVTEIAGGYAQQIETGRHVFAADEPVSAGGTDTGPDPYGLLLGALGACTSMTIRMYAARKQWPLHGISVRLRHAKTYAEDCKSCEDPKAKIDRITREIELSGPLTAEQQSRLVEIANRCPVHRTLMEDKEIVTSLVSP
jgi:putative redox protein